jgi:hypothetical protein
MKSRTPPHPGKKPPTKAGKKKVAAKPKAKATAAKPKATNALRHMMRGSDRSTRDVDGSMPFSTGRGGMDRDADPGRPVRPRRG